MTKSINSCQIEKIIEKFCLKPFHGKAVMDYDIHEMARHIYICAYAFQVETALALAQGILESHFACNPAATRSRKTKNIFNVGNVDSGKNRFFDSYFDGVTQYFRLMDSEYRWPQDSSGKVSMATLVANDFMRPRGGRYATAPAYTSTLLSIYNRIKKEIDLYTPPTTPPPPPNSPTQRMAA